MNNSRQIIHHENGDGRDRVFVPQVRSGQPRGLVLMGRRNATGEQEKYPLNKLTRVHVLGTPGSGKSRLLNSITRDIVATKQAGFTSIDPHGDNLRDGLRFNTLTGQQGRSTLIDPSDTEFSAGINPLWFDPALCKDKIETEKKAAERASAVMKIFSSTFGDEVLNEKPQLSRWLRNALKVLAWQGYTLVHLPLFLHSKAFRQKLVTACREPLLLLEWQEFEDANQKQQIEWKAPLFNRINEIIFHPPLRRMFSQRRPTFDPLTAMDEGRYVFVDLSGLELLEKQFVGRCLVDLYYQSAMHRPENKRRPHYLILDEFHLFVTEDLGDMLLQFRKFNVNIVLAHQTLDSLKDRPKILSAVMGCCDVFVTFQCSRHDAEEMALVHFTGQFRDDIVIAGSQIAQTKFWPRESERIVPSVSQSETVTKNNALTLSRSTTNAKMKSIGIAHTKAKGRHWAHAVGSHLATSDTQGSSSSSGSSSHHGMQEFTSHTHPYDSGVTMGLAGSMAFGSGMMNGETTSFADTTSSATSTMQGSSEADVKGGSKSKALTRSKAIGISKAKSLGKSLTKGISRGRTLGRSYTRQPFYEYEPFQELTPPQYHTPEALKEYATALIYNLQKRHFLFKSGRQQSLALVSPSTELVRMRPEHEAAARQAILQQSGVPGTVADDELMAAYSDYGFSFTELSEHDQLPERPVHNDDNGHVDVALTTLVPVGMIK